MNSQMQISDLENIIAERIFIKIEKWNLYLGDAGLARNLAIECISNLNKGSKEATKLSLNTIKVKIGSGKKTIPLYSFVTSSQIADLEQILDNFKNNKLLVE